MATKILSTDPSLPWLRISLLKGCLFYAPIFLLTQRPHVGHISLPSLCFYFLAPISFFPSFFTVKKCVLLSSLTKSVEHWWPFEKSVFKMFFSLRAAHSLKLMLMMMWSLRFLGLMHVYDDTNCPSLSQLFNTCLSSSSSFLSQSVLVPNKNVCLLASVGRRETFQ